MFTNESMLAKTWLLGLASAGLVVATGGAMLGAAPDEVVQAFGASDRAAADETEQELLAKLVGAVGGAGALTEVSLPGKLIEDVAALRPPSAAQTRAAKLYGYDIAADPEGAVKRGRAVAVPLALGDERGLLVLYRDGAGRRKFAALGLSALEQDATARWQTVLSQLEWKNGSASVESSLGAAEAEQRIEDARAAMRSGDLNGQLFKLRMSMRENSAHFTQLSAAQRGRLVNAEWLGEWGEHLGSVSGFGDTVIEPLYGKDAAEQFARFAGVGKQTLTQASEAYAAREFGRYRELINGLYAASCQACHDVRAGESDATIYRDLPERMTRLGIRADLFAVGVDALGVQGMERESQAVVDAAAVAILLWNALPE